MLCEVNGIGSTHERWPVESNHARFPSGYKMSGVAGQTLGKLIPGSFLDGERSACREMSGKFMDR